MSQRLDREGIFLAKPINWNIRISEHSKSVAVNVEFAILASLEEEGWSDVWSDHDFTVYGSFWFVNKTGELLADQVERLVQSGLWDGRLATVHNEPPPAVEVQITVQGEEYKGNTYYKAVWVNHRDHTPGPKRIDDSELRALEGRFGSMLRAAASSAQQKTAGAGNAGGNGGNLPSADPAPAESKNPEDDLPF